MIPKFKLYSLVHIQEDGYSYIAQVLSLPVPATPERPFGTLMVRRSPGMPASLVEIDLNKVEPMPRKFRRAYVHYARVEGRGAFPVDMLRYDCATPINFTIDDERGRAIKTNADDTSLIVAMTSDKKREDWTYGRWSSFGWRCEAMTHATHEVTDLAK